MEKYCRLCAEVGTNHHCLYTVDGRPNQSHKLLEKYFLPAVEWSNSFRYVCRQCETYLANFNSYQAFVCQAQRKLIKVAAKSIPNEYWNSFRGSVTANDSKNNILPITTGSVGFTPNLSGMLELNRDLQHLAPNANGLVDSNAVFEYFKELGSSETNRQDSNAQHSNTTATTENVSPNVKEEQPAFFQRSNVEANVATVLAPNVRNLSGQDFNMQNLNSSDHTGNLETLPPNVNTNSFQHSHQREMLAPNANVSGNGNNQSQQLQPGNDDSKTLQNLNSSENTGNLEMLAPNVNSNSFQHSNQREMLAPNVNVSGNGNYHSQHLKLGNDGYKKLQTVAPNHNNVGDQNPNWEKSNVNNNDSHQLVPNVNRSKDQNIYQQNSASDATATSSALQNPTSGDHALDLNPGIKNLETRDNTKQVGYPENPQNLETNPSASAVIRLTQSAPNVNNSEKRDGPGTSPNLAPNVRSPVSAAQEPADNPQQMAPNVHSHLSPTNEPVKNQNDPGASENLAPNLRSPVSATKEPAKNPQQMATIIHSHLSATNEPNVSASGNQTHDSHPSNIENKEDLANMAPNVKTHLPPDIGLAKRQRRHSPLSNDGEPENAHHQDSDESGDFSSSASEWSGGEEQEEEDSNTPSNASASDGSSDDELPLAEYKQKKNPGNLGKSLQENTMARGSNENPRKSPAFEQENGHKTAYDFDMSDEENLTVSERRSTKAQREISGQDVQSQNKIYKTAYDFDEIDSEIGNEISYSGEPFSTNDKPLKTALDFDKLDEDMKEEPPEEEGQIQGILSSQTIADKAGGEIPRRNYIESLEDMFENDSKQELPYNIRQFPAAYKFDFSDDETSGDETYFNKSENQLGAKSKRPLKTSYKKHLKRPATREEYDDLIAKWRPSLECRICKATCGRFQQLQQHFADHHPDDECYVECCQLQLGYRYKIEKHIYYHRVEGAFKCEVCFEIFTSKYKLGSHLVQRHAAGGEPKPKEILKCNICGKEYATQCRLHTHLKYCDGSEVPEPGRAKCKDCGKSYRSQLFLELHRRKHHRNKKTFPCPVCDKLFASKHTLHYHSFTHATERKFVCWVCQRTFKVPCILRGHFKHCHVEEYKEKMRKIKELRNTKKTYKCDQCDKVYQTSMALKEHKAQHEGISALYKCKYCSKEYKYSSNLSAHVQRVHPTKYQLFPRFQSP
uniref:C2H2-type domain-containing protein n=1 Tax=Musca domestica TaxID=7370 RepID=A0A1I8MW93_MUSDO